MAEYVRLRLSAYRRHGAGADAASEAAARLGGSAGASLGVAPLSPPPLDAAGGTHHNASVLKTNAMKFLPCFFALRSMSRLFFCFADPQFKPSNHRRRIVTTPLLDEYAAALRAGGRLYVITDVPDLFNWASRHAAARSLSLKRSNLASSPDPTAPTMTPASFAA